MTVMSPAVVDQLYADAAAKAAANPPGRVLATVFLALFQALGWVCGTLWTGMWFCGMAFAYGMSKGSKVPERTAADPRAVPTQ